MPGLTSESAGCALGSGRSQLQASPDNVRKNPLDNLQRHTALPVIFRIICRKNFNNKCRSRDQGRKRGLSGKRPVTRV